MPTILKQADIDNIIKLYTIDLFSVKKVANIIGIGQKRTSDIIKSNGITIRNWNALIISEDRIKEIISLYKYGIGASGIGYKFNISASAINRVLRKNNIHIRTASEQETIKWSLKTPEQRAHQVSACHKSTIGRHVSFNEKIKRAKGKEGKINRHSTYESTVRDILIDNGINFTIGKAVSIYNIDFVVGNIAVEVFGGHWSYSDKGRVNRYIKRTKELAELGYHCIFIMCNQQRPIDADNLIRNINFFRRLPASPCQYRMVWGDFDSPAGLCDELNHIAFVCPFVHVRDTATGRYVSILR